MNACRIFAFSVYLAIMHVWNFFYGFINGFAYLYMLDKQVLWTWKKIKDIEFFDNICGIQSIVNYVYNHVHNIKKLLIGINFRKNLTDFYQIDPIF